VLGREAEKTKLIKPPHRHGPRSLRRVRKTPPTLARQGEGPCGHVGESARPKEPNDAGGALALLKSHATQSAAQPSIKSLEYVRTLSQGEVAHPARRSRVDLLGLC
jgi:hypothetical protein